MLRQKGRQSKRLRAESGDIMLDSSTPVLILGSKENFPSVTGHSWSPGIAVRLREPQDCQDWSKIAATTRYISPLYHITDLMLAAGTALAVPRQATVK